MGYSIWLILLGVLGASSLIIAKRPDAKDAIAKIAPYQGWIGAISVLWGIFSLLQCILNMGAFFAAHWIVTWVAWVGVSLLLMGLGLLLGVGVLKTFIKDATAQKKMDETIARLAPYQGNMGIAAIGLGLAMFVLGFLHI